MDDGWKYSKNINRPSISVTPNHLLIGLCAGVVIILRLINHFLEIAPLLPVLVLCLCDPRFQGRSPLFQFLDVFPAPADRFQCQ